MSKGGVEETEDFKHLVADLSLDEEKAIKREPEHISQNTRDYLEKKREYLDLEKRLNKMQLDGKIVSAEDHTLKVRELVEKLKRGEELSQEERDLMNSIKSNNPDLRREIGQEQASDVNVAESYLNKKTKDRLDELKADLKTLAKTINQENQKLLGHFYQLKETVFELKAYQAELEVLKKAIEDKIKDPAISKAEKKELKKELKESHQKIKTLISDLDKDLKNYESFIKSIEKRLKSTPGSHSRNLNNVANHPNNILFSTNLENLGNLKDSGEDTVKVKLGEHMQPKQEPLREDDMNDR